MATLDKAVFGDIKVLNFRSFSVSQKRVGVFEFGYFRKISTFEFSVDFMILEKFSQVL